MKKLFIVLFLIAFITGCVSTQIRETPQNYKKSIIIQSSKEKIWPIVVAEVTNNYPIQVIEKDSGLIQTQIITIDAGYNNRLMNHWCYAPKGFLYTWNGLKSYLQINVNEIEPNKTQITINAHYEAFEDILLKQWLKCESNGFIENQILTNIERNKL